MKPIRHFIILAFAVVTTLAGAQTNTPGEQFQSAVTTFQKSATEDNARKLAELLKQLDPPPAIPDDAKLHALKGAAFVKQTKSETDRAAYPALFAKAAAEYQAASAAAPWVGEYYFNRAACEKSAGQFAAATAALKLDLIFARTEQDRDANLALRAEIETTQEIAATRKLADEKQAIAKKAEDAKIAKAAEAEKEKLRSTVEGKWQCGSVEFQVVRNGERFTVASVAISDLGIPMHAINVAVDRQHVRFTSEHGVERTQNVFDFTLSASGNELIGNMNNFSKKFTRTP